MWTAELAFGILFGLAIAYGYATGDGEGAAHIGALGSFAILAVSWRLQERLPLNRETAPDSSGRDNGPGRTPPMPTLHGAAFFHERKASAGGSVSFLLALLPVLTVCYLLFA